MTKDRNPMLAAIRAIVLEIFPRLQFAGDLEYSVQSQNGAKVDLRPVDASLKLPPLPGVPFRGAPGVAGELGAGTRVIVRFVNSDPGRPYVAAVVGADNDGFVPENLRVDADGEVTIGASAEDVKLAAALGRALRDGEKVKIDGLTFSGNPVVSPPGLVTISLDPSMLLAGPGAPGVGYSKVKA